MTNLSSLVITRHAATIAQVDEALACQVMRGGDLGTCLLELGAMSEDALLPLLGEAHGLPPMPPGQLPQVSGALLRMVPQAVALTYGIYPVAEVDGELHVAVAEPLPPAVEEDLAFALGAHLKQFASTSLRIRQAIARDYGLPLERRFLRLLASIEKQPDPSPSLAPSRFSRSPSMEPGPTGPVSVMSLEPRKRTWPGMLAVREADKQPPSPAIPAAPAPPHDLDFSDVAAAVEREPSISDRPPPEAEPEEAAASSQRTQDFSGVAAMNGHDGSSAFTPAVPPVSELAPTPIMPPVSELIMASAEDEPPTRFSDIPATLPTGKRVSAAPTLEPAAEPRSSPAIFSAPESEDGDAPNPGEPDPLNVEGPSRRSQRPPGSLPPPPHEFVMEASMATAARVERQRQRRAAQPTGKALVGWARRAAGAADPANRVQDRRRGPLTAGAAELQLDDATTADEALAIFFAFARQYFDYSALFVVHGDLAAGHDAWGAGASRDKVRTIGVALDLPNSLSHARSAGAPVIAPLARTGLDADLRADLARSASRDVIVLPVLIRERCVALLFGDQGHEPVDAAESGAVIAMAPLLGAALERILLRKKRTKARDSLRTKGGPDSSPDARDGRSDRPGEPAESGPEVIIAEADDGASLEFIGEMEADSLPPPSGSGAQRLEGMSGEAAGSADQLENASMSVSPHPPPVSRAPQHELPRVLIRSDLVDLVIAGGERGERALGEILSLGEAAIPSVFARFPGPLTVDRNQAIGDLPRPADCGPVLRIVAAMRRLALPFLAVRSADTDVEVRFWATYLLGELNYADVAAALVPRLFDENTAVRRIAVRSARSLSSAGDQGVPLRKALERTMAYREEPEGRRLIALWTIGELRLYRSIPTLISVLGDPIESIADAALRSLVAMTRQEFGKNAEKWNDWWETKGRRRLP